MVDGKACLSFTKEGGNTFIYTTPQGVSFHNRYLINYLKETNEKMDTVIKD